MAFIQCIKMATAGVVKKKRIWYNKIYTHTKKGEPKELIRVDIPLMFLGNHLSTRESRLIIASATFLMIQHGSYSHASCSLMARCLVRKI
jgi:hypothetical protein